jgi:chemotaxis protein MotB
MRRHSLPAAPRTLRASGDRWLFGYADVVTLLFACFASLYAAKVVPAAEGPNDIVLTREGRPKPPVEDRAIALRRELQAVVEHRSGDASVDLTSSARGLVLSLAETGSFPPGRADLTADAREVMRTVANALGRIPNFIRVEGHTDDTPIRTPLFASNWELSTARATRVVQFLTGEGALDPARFSAAGYAEFRPRIANASSAARARNRRVDIVVLDVAALNEEPGTAGVTDR